jgi:RNA polymerase sigma factor (sigma-70 family)
MVVGVCRRLLGNATDVEDAFQATFLVLLHKARSLTARAILGDWLHQVARHTAMKARVAGARRRVKEQSAARPESAPADAAPGEHNEWLARLDDELRRLPQKYRLPVMLCDLECKTRRETADQLGWPEGTVAGRLARGRALLAKRLLRGAQLVAGALPGLVAASTAEAAIRPETVDALVCAAARVVAGSGPSGVLSAKTLALAQGVIRAMFWNKLKTGALLLLAVCALVGGGGLTLHAIAGAGQTQPMGLAALPVAPQLQAQLHAPVQAQGQLQARAKIGEDLFTLRGHTLGVSSVAFAPDKRRLASASADGTVKVWDITTGKELLTLRGHDKQVWCVAFNPKRDELASGGADGTVKIWDLDEGKEVLTFTGHSHPGSSVHSLAFSPDGKRLASGNGSPGGPISVLLWDAATGKVERTLPGYTGMVSSLAFSADGKRLASASGDRKLKVWDVATGKELVSIASPSNYFASIAFSPDGKRLVSANDNKTVTVWDAAEGTEILVLKGHNREVTSAAFSPDGKLVASGGFDATLRLWDATTGKELDRRGGYMREIHSVAFNPQGTLLATGSADGLVKVWEIKR